MLGIGVYIVMKTFRQGFLQTPNLLAQLNMLTIGDGYLILTEQATLMRLLTGMRVKWHK